MLLMAEGSRLRRLADTRAVTVTAVTALCAAFYAGFDKGLIGDGDTSWHVATGRWILSNRAVPDGDPFSFSMPGKEWHAHEWLSEIPMAVAFDLAGWPGVVLLFALAFGLTMFMVGRELGRHLPTRWVAATLAGLFVVLVGSALARPHVLAWPVLAGWLLLLIHAREGRRAPPLLAALLMVLWANLHASYILGLGLAGVFALESLVEDRAPAKTIRAWLPFGLLTLAAAFFTPHGVQGFLYPFQVSGMQALVVIQEWRPTRLPADAVFLAYMVAIGGLGLLGWRRLGAVRLVLLLGVGWMALEHVRHHPVFALVTVLAIVPRAASKFTERERPRPTVALARSTAALLGTGLTALVLLRLAVPLVPSVGPSFMGKALDAVPLSVRSQPVFNSYSFGGPLILQGVRVFIDGRADMYGDRFTLDYNRIADGDLKLFRAAAQRYRFGWTILDPQDKLAKKLDREPGWKRLYGDEGAIVHVRTKRP